MIPEADSAFVCAMEDVLDVCTRPYDVEDPVVCLDESPKQLVSELRKPYMGQDGIKYQDCEYEREGAAELMMIAESLGGRRAAVPALDFQYEKKCFFYVFRVNPCAKSVWVGNPIFRRN
ncbi:MAG: hypothetical protein ACJAWV_002114 [Flammeovirgaceae bacterium]